MFGVFNRICVLHTTLHHLIAPFNECIQALMQRLAGELYNDWIIRVSSDAED